MSTPSEDKNLNCPSVEQAINASKWNKEISWEAWAKGDPIEPVPKKHVKKKPPKK